MIDDAANIQNGATFNTDVCIVGAGPAGISLAMDLSGRGLSVMLLESGYLELDAKTQSL
ncbi:FAD-dependent oxidoreductase, partial [Polaromonas sp.]|uniref:FAD-dependent oxidoreductase n=1 Tax=Polaromonas sp. TaxID=1869339 RepID=UPI002B6839C5